MKANTQADHDKAAHGLNPAMLRYHDALHRNYIVASASVRPIVDKLATAMRGALEELHKANCDDAAVTTFLQLAAALRKEISETAGKDFRFKIKA